VVERVPLGAGGPARPARPPAARARLGAARDAAAPDTPAPSPWSCAQPADGELRTALALYHQAIQEEESGLDRSDVAAVANGALTVGRATDDLRTASSLLAGSC
jgi:hypothetical protein